MFVVGSYGFGTQIRQTESKIKILFISSVFGMLVVGSYGFGIQIRQTESETKRDKSPWHMPRAF